MRSKLEGNSRGVRFPMPPLLPGAGQRLQGSVQCPPRPNTCEHQTPTPAPLPAPDKSLSCEKKMLPGNVTGPGGGSGYIPFSPPRSFGPRREAMLVESETPREHGALLSVTNHDAASWISPGKSHGDGFKRELFPHFLKSA